MGWRDRKRNEIINKYRSELSVDTFPDVGLLNSEVYQNKSTTFTILPVAFTEQPRFAPAHRRETPVTISHEEAITEAIAFQPASQCPELLSDGNIRVSNVCFDAFPLTITRFSFESVRQEKQPLLPRITQQAKFRRRLAQVKPPPRPPTFGDASLEERLRWVLTPPIHELLSDPQLALPEKPFPFQTSGVKWLYDRHGALLADEMGLGKTMQAIIAARLLWRARIVNQILVICPKTVIPTWQAEIRKWWPQVGPNVMLAGSEGTRG